jgi:hypothetical protein
VVLGSFKNKGEKKKMFFPKRQADWSAIVPIAMSVGF